MHAGMLPPLAASQHLLHPHFGSSMLGLEPFGNLHDELINRSNSMPIPLGQAHEAARLLQSHHSHNLPSTFVHQEVSAGRPT